MMKFACAALLGAGLLATGAQAHDLPMVSAADPKGMADALEMAGYKPELSTDVGGDPMIELEFGKRSGRIYFYGCDETTHDGCDAVQFSSGFDRETPWTAAEAIKLSEQFRFIAVSLDEEGDPYASWDIVTDDGIPTKVFLRSVLWFTDALADADDIIFAEERAAKSQPPDT